jgi:thiamine-monophosphate kinase
MYETVADVGERALIARITARLSVPSWVLVGPGDDAAVIAPDRGALQAITTDAVVDGVHFDQRFVPSDAIGHRALAVNLSDLAAMGARPRAALLSLVLPDVLPLATLDGIMDGLLSLADRHQVAVIGGNITRTPGPLTIDVTAIGSVRRRRTLTRTGARPGDEVYVTGAIGDAGVGLRMLRENAAGGSRQKERYLRPDPRIRAGRLLGQNRAATSCMDLSDGLADGLRQIADASSVGITIDAGLLPVTDEVRAWHAARGEHLADAVLAAGDDYELLFTVRPAQRGRLRSVRGQLGDLPITRIGEVTKGRELRVTEAGSIRELPRGFEHFRS